MAWVIAIIAGLFGAFDDSGFTRFLVSCTAGWLLVKHFERQRRDREVSETLRLIERDNERLRARWSGQPAGEPAPAAEAPEARRETPIPAPPPEAERPSPKTPPADFQIPFETPRRAEAPPRPPKPREKLPPPPWVRAVTNFFTTGNVFAKVGALLLFVGVGFLIKFVSDLGLFPIEGRLIGTALGANVLIGLGWKLRKKRASYALILQGVGFGILYLTVFGAYRQWDLLPAPLAFGVLVAATLLFSMLAVLQNALSLAALAVTGGFSAPLLVNTGSGNFVGLFSYYALLNVGVLLVTWFRAWRELHLLGFLFTYGVGFLWGAHYFVPEHFPKVEPFLVFHFVLYVVVALRFARLKRGEARSLAVDGLLVFGVPMATFALQSAMLKDTRFGIALSAAALGLFYLTLATFLFRRKNPEARALVESFLTSGLLFNTIAVPFALSHTWTSAVWAIEGAFLVWYGARQERKTIRAFGFFLQVLGYLAYVAKTTELTGLIPWVNPGFVGAITLFAAAIFTSYQLFKKSKTFSGSENQLLVPFLCFAFTWILYAFYREAYVTAATWYGPDAVGFGSLVDHLRVGFLGGLVLVFHVVARRLAWAALGALRFALFLVVLLVFSFFESSRPAGFTPYLNPYFVSAMVFTVAALLSATSVPGPWVRRLFLFLGFGFWTGAHWTELYYAFSRWVPDAGRSWEVNVLRTNVFMILVTVSALLFFALGRLLRQPLLGRYGRALTAFGTLYLVAQILGSQSPFAQGGLVAWAALLATHYLLLARSDRGAETFDRYGHFTGLWLGTAVLCWFAFRVAEVEIGATSVWKETFLLAVPLIVVAAVLRWPKRFPIGRWRDEYVTLGLLPHVVAVTFFAQYWNLANPGDPTPLPYVPGANPLGIVVGASLLALIYWYREAKRSPWAARPGRFAGLVGAFAFLWLTMGVVRAVHHHAGVPWDFEALAASRQLQTSLSIFWSILGLATMIVGHRRGLRPLWIFGCCLLVLVVGKLLLVDLKERGTLERIISFIGTGIVLLLTGYFAPIPPSRKQGTPHEP